jgi:hypothetical protein
MFVYRPFVAFHPSKKQMQKQYQRKTQSANVEVAQ